MVDACQVNRKRKNRDSLKKLRNWHIGAGLALMIGAL